MKKYFLSTIAGVFIFFFAGIMSVAYAAGTLIFDPSSTDVAVDQTFTIDINIDAGTDQIASTDIYIDFDETNLELDTVSDGDYFPDVSNQPLTGRLYIAGLMQNPGEYKEGIGNVAKVTFKAIALGSTSITFDCDTTETETSKIIKNDANATNVIDCDALAAHTVNITASDGTTSSTTSTLPQSGVYDEVLKYLSFGGVLLLLGIVIRVFMRFM